MDKEGCHNDSANFGDSGGDVLVSSGAPSSLAFLSTSAVHPHAETAIIMRSLLCHDAQLALYILNRYIVHRYPSSNQQLRQQQIL